VLDNEVNYDPAYLRAKYKKVDKQSAPEPGVTERVIEALMTNGCSHPDAIHYEHHATGVRFNERFKDAICRARARADWDSIEKVRAKKPFLTVVQARECFIEARTLLPNGDHDAIIARACELADERKK
jgi:hypothetical protein